MTIIKGKSINGISQVRCPFEYAKGSSNVRIGSTWCKECPNFMGYVTSRRTGEPLYGTYDITVKCKCGK